MVYTYTLGARHSFKQNPKKNSKRGEFLKKGAISLGLFLAVVSCSNENKRQLASEFTQNSAPQSQAQAGVIVNGVSQYDLQAFLEKYQLKARVLHQETGTYEVFTQDKTLIEKSFVKAKVLQNIYLENLFVDGKNPVVKLKTRSTLGELMQDSGAIVQDPAKCTRNPLEGPQPKLENKVATGLDSVDTYGTINLSGNFLAFTAENSENAPEGSVYMWQVVPPEVSKVNAEIQDGKEINFVPDVPGAYMVALLVIDKENKCNLAQTIFAVTVNPEKTATIEPRPFEEADKAFFHHLGLIQAREAQVFSKGEGIKIAIVDSGVNYNHPDLSKNIYTNDKEIPDNGLDDDSNGFVDDVNGWDFVNSDAHPFDDQGHGTHVAGLSASAVSGVAPKATIIPVKAMSAFGSGDIATLVGGIMYAVDSGAHIINMSLGGSHPSFEAGIKLAMDYAEQKGVIVLAAAGNGHPVFGVPMDNDQFPVYPANMPNKNIIVVAATDKEDKLTEYSNYGKTTVDIAAPGGSTRKGDSPLNATFYWPTLGTDTEYVGFSGTSMATPVSAGVVAVLLSLDPKLNAENLIEVFKLTSKKGDPLKEKVVSEGVVDALSAAAYVSTLKSIQEMNP